MNDEDKKSAAPESTAAAKSEKPVTLSEAEISSERNVSRRSLLGAIGIGAGVFAAAVLGGTNSAEARRVCDRDPYDRCFDVTDSDPYDRGADPYDTR